jgi:6-phosphogluconolactonase (cycloisomerase 2 family)
VVFTTAPGVHDSLLAGTGVYRLTPGEARPVQIVSGQPFNHLAVSDDGRFFIVDDYRTQTIHIGSVETGRFLKLCDSRTRQGKPQYTHAHPYLTPDNRHVIFNSNVTGVTQVYAATVSDEFLDKLAPLKKDEPKPQP